MVSSVPSRPSLSGEVFAASLQFAGNVPPRDPDTLDPPSGPISYYNFAVSFLKANRQSNDIYWSDVNAIPSLIQAEMSHCPGLKISHHDSPHAFMAHVGELCRAKTHHREQCLVEWSADEGHCVAIDLLVRDAQPSLIAVESGTLNAQGPAGLLMRLRFALERHEARIVPNGLERHLLFLETHAQQSPVDCAMFSLQNCKAMFRDAEAFEALHDRLRSGEFADMLSKGYASSEECDAIVPPSLMKHTQSSRRLADYERRHLEGHPERSATISRLTRRQRGLTFSRNERTYSVSIEMARVKTAGRALAAGGGDRTLQVPSFEHDFLSSAESE
ncbi:YopJ family acetyltransferase [Pandoraea pulmonicola]|uniref:Virulence factor yopJ n=2 Tax=Pandoraea pulmonicola TaxID=93221 RepID=A0AAJ4ZCB3_PANPU|nr:YopJ family acetyltransferase [Pandoraea pulmonicola]SUA90782.1 Virulence factor yopJ [Pandoraea pulmonicola]